MLFGMSTIISKWSHSPDLIIFRYSCFKIGQSEPRVAYKSVANKTACMLSTSKPRASVLIIEDLIGKSTDFLNGSIPTQARFQRFLILIFTHQTRSNTEA